MKKKTTFIASLGSGLEYYDFVIFAYLASYISTNFFPHSDPFTEFLQTVCIFAAAYISRPLGGMVFGIFGDRFGRKNTFLVSITFMAFATLGIGCLPSFETWGWASPILLAVLRIIQGISQGAELPGAVTFVNEHCDEGERGFHSSWLMFGIAAGAAFGSLVSFSLAGILSESQMTSWGFRIPFILGGIFSLFAFYFRRQLTETPAFLNQKTPKKISIITLVKKYPVQLLNGFLIVLLPAVMIIFSVFLPAFLQKFYEYPASSTYAAKTLSLFVGMFLIPVFGKFSDKIGFHRMYMALSLIILFFIQFLFQLLTLNSSIGFYSFFIIYEILMCAFVASYPVMLADIFPTEVRYTGVAICYNTGYSVAAFTPMFTTYLTSYSNSAAGASYMFPVLATVSLLAVLSLLRSKTKVYLPAAQP